MATPQRVVIFINVVGCGIAHPAECGRTVPADRVAHLSAQRLEAQPIADLQGHQPHTNLDQSRWPPNVAWKIPRHGAKNRPSSSRASTRANSADSRPRRNTSTGNTVSQFVADRHSKQHRWPRLLYATTWVEIIVSNTSATTVDVLLQAKLATNGGTPMGHPHRGDKANSHEELVGVAPQSAVSWAAWRSTGRGQPHNCRAGQLSRLRSSMYARHSGPRRAVDQCATLGSRAPAADRAPSAPPRWGSSSGPSRRRIRRRPCCRVPSSNGRERRGSPARRPRRRRVDPSCSEGWPPTGDPRHEAHREETGHAPRRTRR